MQYLLDYSHRDFALIGDGSTTRLGDCGLRLTLTAQQGLGELEDSLYPPQKRVPTSTVNILLSFFLPSGVRYPF